MHGDLSNTTLAGICRALASARATGRLVVGGGGEPGSVTLRDGAISDARSPQPRARLASRLTGGGHLDELTLDRVLQDLRRGLDGSGSNSEVVDDLALARALLDGGLVDPLVIEDVLVGQIVDGMVELRARRTGRYGFEPSGPDPSQTSVRPLVDVETLLEEVRKREDRLAGLPPAALRPDTVPHLQPTQLAGADHDGEHLGADAVTVLGAIDERRNLWELARALGYGGYDLACVLADLSERGVVTLSDPAEGVGAALDLAERRSDHLDPTAVAGDTSAGASNAEEGVPDLGDAADASGSTSFGGEVDVSEFLRELSSLARGDDAPPTPRTSAAPAGDATRRTDREGHEHTGSAAEGGAEDRPGAPRSPRSVHKADEATDRGNGQRRRRRLFGRG
ncbi:MAG: DUF4388 domain-containing protein [Nitriliruptor sp.]|nr:MAG: DUF4388 domain-containing protein [Nitriliruptor sp.]